MRAVGCEERCPGCGHRDYGAEESLERKNAWLATELSRWRGRLRPVLPSPRRWGYRRKALLHARFLAGRWRFGLVRMHGPEEEFVAIPDCPLQSEETNAAFRLAGDLLPEGIPVAFGLVSGRAFTLVVKSTRRPDWAESLRAWARRWPGGHSFFVNWNPGAGRRAIDSRRTELLFGEAWLEEGGLRHGPSAFRQQIPELADAALGRAQAFLAEAGLAVIADFYCGLGAGLVRWQACGWRAVGVELSGESLAAAERNAPLAERLRGRVEDRLPQVEEFLGEGDFVVYTNPPRSGHAPSVLHWLLTKKPARIAYLSCHPRSLAGDLGALAEAYEVVEIQPFDFFPQTSHVESLALLRRRD